MRHPVMTHRWKRGFTLVELLVAGGIGSIVLLASFVAFIGLQRSQTSSLERIGLRTNMLRFVDVLESDLHNATAASAAVSGNANVLPVTLTAPQRYSSYERNGAMAGEPGRSATRAGMSVNGGKVQASTTITITYAEVPNGATRKDVTRTVTWTEAGAQVTARRVVATFPSDAVITFRNAGGGLLQNSDLEWVTNVSARSAGNISRGAPTSMRATIFLRNKSLAPKS